MSPGHQGMWSALFEPQRIYKPVEWIQEIRFLKKMCCKLALNYQKLQALGKNIKRCFKKQSHFHFHLTHLKTIDGQSHNKKKQQLHVHLLQTEITQEVQKKAVTTHNSVIW